MIRYTVYRSLQYKRILDVILWFINPRLTNPRFSARNKWKTSGDQCTPPTLDGTNGGPVGAPQLILIPTWPGVKTWRCGLSIGFVYNDIECNPLRLVFNDTPRATFTFTMLSAGCFCSIVREIAKFISL